MKQVFFVSLLVSLMAGPALAQESAIYRCGNEYTNTKPDALTRGCKLVSGGNVTVVQGTRVPKPTTPRASTPSGPSSSGNSRIESTEQKARDSDARLILQAELKKAQDRQEEMRKEYNNGEPEKRGEEVRNPQKYQDRVAELKANLARNESDIAGIRRELERLPPGASASLVR